MNILNHCNYLCNLFLINYFRLFFYLFLPTFFFCLKCKQQLTLFISEAGSQLILLSFYSIGFLLFNLFKFSLKLFYCLWNNNIRYVYPCTSFIKSINSFVWECTVRNISVGEFYTCL